MSATPTPEVSFDAAFASYREWIGSSINPVVPERRGRPHKKQRIIVAGDFHCPHQIDEAVKKLIHNESRDTDLLVIDGDFMDLGSVSRWPKFTKQTAILDDCRVAQKVMTVLSEAFRKIVVIPGNHDKRLLKKMADGGVPGDVMQYLREAAPQALDPLLFVTAGLRNVEMAPPIMCGDASYDYLWQQGDLVVGHPESYSKIPAKGSGLFLDWVMKTAVPAGIIRQPVRLILQGHTHGAGLVWNDYGVWSGETGCMCKMGDYTSDPKLRTPRPWCPGYVVTEQAEGATDVNATRFVSL